MTLLPADGRVAHLVDDHHLDVDDEIDREARARLKHLQEGTSAFDIEYNKTVDQIRRAIAETDKRSQEPKQEQ